MIDSVTTDSDSRSDPHGPPPPGNDQPTESLVHRVERLEDAVAALQDTRHMEDRILERVNERFAIKQAPAPSTASGHEAPATPDAAPTEQVPVENMVTAERRTPATPGPEVFGRPHDLMAAVPHPLFSDSGKQPWLIFDVYSEFRTILRMYVDFRYRVSWSARLLPMVLLGAILLSWLWVPGIAFLPTMFATVLDKTVDLILAFFLYKILSREARRYREALAKLPPELQRF
jgi:hypothetical protein